MDLFGDVESLPSFIRQKLVPVASRKVCEGMRFWRNLMNFIHLPNSHFLTNFARSHRDEFLSYGAGKGFKITGKIHTFCLEYNILVLGPVKLIKNIKQSIKSPKKRYFSRFPMSKPSTAENTVIQGKMTPILDIF